MPPCCCSSPSAGGEGTDQASVRGDPHATVGEEIDDAREVKGAPLRNTNCYPGNGTSGTPRLFRGTLGVPDQGFGFPLEDLPGSFAEPPCLHE